jgi:hypothetical protein
MVVGQKLLLSASFLIAAEQIVGRERSQRASHP